MSEANGKLNGHNGHTNNGHTVAATTSEPKKAICLGMPSYGEVTIGAAQGLYRSSRRASHELRIMNGTSSLLAANMNGLWAWALTHAHKGQCDYFAMLHADVEPEEFWLDKLIDELDEKNLDVLAAVVPIKDQRGVTSTAMGKLDGDTWRVHGRLTMKEVFRLPETFTAADVGYPLLINTGCWVCKFDESWAKQCHFTINDRICYDPKRELYFAQVESEDWFISRLFNDLGLKVGVTRKVMLGHRGTMCFTNSNPWGSEFDQEYLLESVLGKLPGAEWFPHDVAGWLTEGEGAELSKLAEGRVVLEIGSYCGRSTICLAQKARNVAAVDTFDGNTGGIQLEDTMEKFKANVARYGVAKKINAIRGRSDEVVPTLPPIFELVFIDGAHDYESVKKDIAVSLRALRTGGLIAFHDYRRFAGEVADSRYDPGVTRAVNELIESGAELLFRRDSLAVVRPPVREAEPLKDFYGATLEPVAN